MTEQRCVICEKYLLCEHTGAFLGLGCAKWQPKKEKKCRNCKFSDLNREDEPCKSCDVVTSTTGNKYKHTNWQPKEEAATAQTSRQDVADKIALYCDDIKKLFAYKNSDYGAEGDGYANFRKTAQRIVIPFMERHGVKMDEKEAMFVVILIYMDKHLVALSHTGIKGNEVLERLGDIANYSLILKSLVESK
jgi:hypothetical protein